MSISVHTANPREAIPLPQAGGRLLRRSCDRLGRPAELRLGEAGRAFLCFNGDPVRGVRRIDATPDSSKLEFAMGPWEDRADLAYQPVNTVFNYNGTNYDDFGRPETDPGFGKHKERLAPYLIDDTADGVFVHYRYGADGRLRQTVTPGGVQTTDYLAGTNLAAARTWQPETGQPQNTVYQYDNFQRLTGISGAVAYELNDADQRIQAALSDGTAWTYTYDDLGQLATANRGITNAMAYTYDTFGNRTEATEDGETTAYATNNLNQYTAINQASPTYDADGNLLTCHGWTYTWNAENRLIRATDGTTTVEANYDYLGRRFVKKVYNGQTLISHQHFLYDNFKLIAICDALDGNKITTTFTWQPTGPDVPLTMTHNGETCHYITDGNKNVLRLLRPNGSAAATYAYAPFGQTLEATGPWATLNPFRFSSEYHDDETNLVYYNYRYYSPELGRWLRRDPIAEDGGVNLYANVNNKITSQYDTLGLGLLDWILTGKWDTSLIDCCGTTEYNNKTHCCIDDTTLIDKNDTFDVKICDGYMGMGRVPHTWVESGGVATGFYGGEYLIDGIYHDDIASGYATRPESDVSLGTDNNVKNCDTYKLSQCEYDGGKFQACIQNKQGQRAPYFAFPIPAPYTNPYGPFPAGGGCGYPMEGGYGYPMGIPYGPEAFPGEHDPIAVDNCWTGALRLFRECKEAAQR